MEKAGLLQDRDLSPTNALGRAGRWNWEVGMRGLLCRVLGLVGYSASSNPTLLPFIQQLSPGRWDVPTAGSDWGRRKLVNREGISWLFTRAVETLERTESVSLVLCWIPTPLCPSQSREDVSEPSSPEQQKSVLMKAQDWFCWKNLTFICHWSAGMVLWVILGLFKLPEPSGGQSGNLTLNLASLFSSRK